MTDASSTDIDVMDYRPDPTLDAELAELTCAAVRGWPDEQPCTAAVTRSTLRPVGLTATTLALHRDAAGVLRAAAAIRWPATIDAPGCLWGPMVHPDAVGAGLATALLDVIAGIMAAHPGVEVVTSEIPESRTAGWGLFERAGWRAVGTTQLLKRSLPAADLAPARIPVRTVQPGEYLDQALANLVTAARPDACYATARDTYARWRADARFVPEGLLLVDGPDGLAGAALVYPLRHPDRPETAEALLAEVLVTPRLDAVVAADVRGALVAAALRCDAVGGARVARAVTDDPETTRSLQAAGFQIIETYRHYSQRVTQRSGTAAPVPVGAGLPS